MIYIPMQKRSLITSFFTQGGVKEKKLLSKWGEQGLVALLQTGLREQAFAGSMIIAHANNSASVLFEA